VSSIYKSLNNFILNLHHNNSWWYLVPWCLGGKKYQPPRHQDTNPDSYRDHKEIKLCIYYSYYYIL